MIWNPWKKIKRLQAMARDDYYVIADLQEALLDIIAEEKPTSNATVKRICKMAREALK